MSTNTAPDNWESQADSTSANNSPTQTADVTAKFSTLNVNAVEFVPSFAMPAVDSEQDSPTKSEGSGDSENRSPSPILNGQLILLSNLRFFDSCRCPTRLYKLHARFLLNFACW